MNAMKRHVIILAVLTAAGCAWHLPANAQLQDERHNFAIGVNGGVNISSVSFQPSIKQSNLIGPEFGITARYISEKYFKMICGIQAELNFSQRGWKEVIEDGSGDTYHRKMNYIEIPLLAHLAFGKDKGNGVRFVLNLGPQVGFLIGEKEFMSDPWDPSRRPQGTNEQYGKMADRKFDYGIIGGGGLEARTGIGHFILEARYYYGLSDFYNNSKKDYFGRSGHSYIGARLTYLFDLKK